MTSSASVGLVKIPHRFEALRDTVGAARLAQVLIEPSADVAEMKKALADVKGAGQGKLLFLLGDTGVGKTSLAESLPIFLPMVVGKVTTPPPDYKVPLRELPGWLARNASLGSGSGINIVNLDGREIPAVDEQEAQTAMLNLNALLRRTPNVLAVWPIISSAFAEAAIARLTQVGGQSALAHKPMHRLIGIAKERYFDALRLLLEATSAKLDDAAVSRDEAEALIPESANLGDFLTRVHQLVVSRYDLGELGAKLPKLYIVVSASNEDLAANCRILRRGNRFAIDPDRLLQFSRSNVADDWRSRGQRNVRHGLAFMTSLFEAKILNLSPSAVVNACAWAEDEEIKNLVRPHHSKWVLQNADNTLASSSLLRALRAEEDAGFAPNKAGASKQTLAAYLAVQRRAKDRHGAINAAIVTVVQRLMPELSSTQLEYCPLQNEGKELRADVWFQRGERPEALEFTHYDQASEATISTYVLQKIQDYARDYGLI